jgi:two-component system response regulator HupR/HoxA
MTGAREPVLLLVDDEPLNRDLLRRVFAHEYELREAEDAAQAVAILEGEPIDVVLCDHLMPGRTGADLALEIRRRWPAARLVLLTGYEDSPEIETARKAGAIFEVVGKPWVARTLRDAIARALLPDSAT